MCFPSNANWIAQSVRCPARGLPVRCGASKKCNFANSVTVGLVVRALTLMLRYRGSDHDSALPVRDTRVRNSFVEVEVVIRNL